MSKVKEYYKNYLNTKYHFDLFHNEVMNMPRDEFGSAGLKKIKMLAGYLLLIEDEINNEAKNYKQILGYMINKIASGTYPSVRNEEFESRYLALGSKTLDQHYEFEGRMFRHLMGICAFFDLVYSEGKQKKVIKFDTCRILAKSDDEILIPIFKNILMNININNNDYIKSMSSINLKKEANYKPASAILKYLFKINRSATLFEISLLLGRIDQLQTEEEILERAISIGKDLPIDHEKQKNIIFKELGWITSDSSYDYAASQQPDFKFKSFILYMKDLGLVSVNDANRTINLTEYSRRYVEEDTIPDELLDLEELINKIDNTDTKDSELINLIIKKRSKQLSDAINANNSILLKKINLRALNNIEYDAMGKRKRNKFIVELAKFKANYICQVSGKPTFRMPNGDNYVEAHHLIEFSRENGPDIVENMLILGPEKHRLIHHACQEDIDDLYNHLKTIGIITFELFKNMIIDYNCLTIEHLEVLKNKKLISSIQYEELSELIDLQVS